MGKKKSEKNNRGSAGKKTDLKGTPLIVDQVGNGDGIPTSPAGLATLVNVVNADKGNESKTIVEKTDGVSKFEGVKTEAETVEKQIQPSPPRPDENTTLPLGKEDDNPVSHAVANSLLKNEESFMSKLIPDLLQAKEGSLGSDKKSNAHTRDSNSQFSTQPSNRSLGRMEKSPPSRETSLFMQIDKGLPPLQQKDPSNVVQEQEKRAVSKENEPSLPFQRQDEFAVTKELSDALSVGEMRPAQKRKETLASRKNVPVFPCRENKDQAISRESRNTLSKQEKRSFSKENEVSLSNPKLEERAISKEPIASSSEREETMGSKTPWKSPDRKKYPAVPKNPKVKRLRQIFDENAQPAQKFDPTNLNFETSINEESLGSLLDIPASHALKPQLHSLKQDIDSDNRRGKQNNTSSVSHANSMGPAQVSTNKKKKLTDASIATKLSSNHVETETRSDARPATVPIHREISSGKERSGRELVRRRNRKSPGTKDRTLKETSGGQSILSTAVKGDTSSPNTRNQKSEISGRKTARLYREKAGNVRTTQRETLNSSKKKNGTHHESLKISRTDTEDEQYKGRSRTSKLYEKRIGKNFSKMQSQVQESIDLDKSSRCKVQAMQKEGAISKERSRSGSQTRTSKKARVEREYRDNSSTRNSRECKRKAVSTELVSYRSENRKSRSKSRGKPDVRRSLLPFSFSMMLGRNEDDSGMRQLEYGLSNTIFQVMEIVENKIAKECFVKKKEVHSKSCYPFRK